ncbi:MAG: SAM-dependent chlorinase/fluorinase [Oculatellaceae cyanobacterium bins.114]|nr:SAM-dependent chlorinase/fluorinase [Oculatellaceae cyanobacterium bins.114]
MMPAHYVLTLLTDFGDRDVYVGVMKGAIAHVNPQLTVIDLTHHIPPQNLAAARFNLMNAYPYFPVPTVHVAVVDPGVGSQRRAIAIQLANGFLVGPDNGIFSGVLDHFPAIAAIELSNTDYWRTASPSATFQGRDIFAPVGAHLASGIPLKNLGSPIDPATLVYLPIAPATKTSFGFQGSIQYVDHFGNSVTNISANCLQNQPWFLRIHSQTIPSHQTYTDVEPGHSLALIGSHNWVEIAINRGNAAAQLHLQVGDRVEIYFTTLASDASLI